MFCVSTKSGIASCQCTGWPKKKKRNLPNSGCINVTENKSIYISREAHFGEIDITLPWCISCHPTRHDSCYYLAPGANFFLLRHWADADINAALSDLECFMCQTKCGIMYRDVHQKRTSRNDNDWCRFLFRGGTRFGKIFLCPAH